MAIVICIADSVDMNIWHISCYLNGNEIKSTTRDGHTLYVINSGCARNINISIDENNIIINDKERFRIRLTSDSNIRICISHVGNADHHKIQSVMINNSNITKNLKELQVNDYSINWYEYNYGKRSIYLCSIDGSKICNFIRYFNNEELASNILININNILH